MSSEAALLTVGTSCATGGMILWLSPRGRPARAAACVAAGAGLTGLLAATGLDSVEERLGAWGSARLYSMGNGPAALILVGILSLVGISALCVCLAAAWLYLGEAVMERERRPSWETAALLCASVGAFGWAMTVLRLYGFFEFVWGTDLATSLPPRGAVEAGLTILDMTGLAAALSLPSRSTVR